MRKAVVPLFVGVLILGTLVAFITVKRSAPYAQDERVVAHTPTVTRPPTVVPSPVSFYARNTIVADEGNNDMVLPNSLYFTLIQIGQPGFLVIRESETDQPGRVLGTSGLLESGRHENMSLPLSRTARNKEMFFASLYGDDGDGIFDITADVPLLREDGSLVTISFRLEADHE